jgi:hypothetical protein
MVDTQTPSRAENLTRAGDLQEYADTIPIHRLQILHNTFAIVLADVQALTFHLIELNQATGEIVPICATLCADERHSLRGCAASQRRE